MEPTEEVAVLWQELFGEPPVINADLEMLARVLVKHLNAAPPYRPKPQTPQPSGRVATLASRRA